MTKHLPPRKKSLLDRAVDRLAKVPGIVAIALGGSHARGTQTPQSDLDIGLYYREATPFRIADIREIAHALSESGSPTVTDFYEWGPFVNGGAWIDNAVCKIDFLYRNLDQLEAVVREAEAGHWAHHFDQQPPFGFRTVTTLGEISYCEPLLDPEAVLTRLKARVAVYPPALKAHIIQSALWLAEFSFTFAEVFARDGDVPNTVGCMTRIYHYLVHALFALNEAYLVNEKRSHKEIAAFSLVPSHFQERASAVLGHPGISSDELQTSIAAIRELWRETVKLAGSAYRSKYAF